MRGVHAENRVQDPQRMLEARRAVYRELLIWTRHRHLPRNYRREIQRLNLAIFRDWRALLGLIALDPQMLFHPRLRERIMYRLPQIWPSRRP
jgi:hypothetical protein